MAENPFVEDVRGVGVGVDGFLAGEFLDGRKSLALRGIRDEDEGDGRADEAAEGGEQEAPLPAGEADEGADDDLREELAELRG